MNSVSVVNISSQGTQKKRKFRLLKPAKFLAVFGCRTVVVELDCSRALRDKKYSALGHHLMTSSELSLRLARPAEAATIANLSRDLIENGLRWRWTPMRVAASIRATDVNVLVACIRENIAGFAIMRYGDDDAHLDLLAVAPRYRRAGIGRRLLDWLERCAFVAGICTITLEVRAGNQGARLFYERMGYRPLVNLPGYYQGIEAALRMGRDLSCRPMDHGIQRIQYHLSGFGVLYLATRGLSSDR
jgi:ribosomal-protein-alanine N-acetyltransferase